jgi:hypothetical protein
MTRMNIGMTLLRMDRPSDAEPLMRASLKELQRLRPAIHPDLVQASISVGRLELVLGHPQQALELFDRADAISHALAPDAAQRPTLAFHRARALWDLNRDRASAHATVRAARVPLAAEAEGSTAELREIDKWLAEHPAP